MYVDGTKIRTWTSSGKTGDFESIDLTGNDGQLMVSTSFSVSGQVLKLSGSRAASEWISILEVRGVGLPIAWKRKGSSYCRLVLVRASLLAFDALVRVGSPTVKLIKGVYSQFAAGSTKCLFPNHLPVATLD